MINKSFKLNWKAIFNIQIQQNHNYIRVLPQTGTTRFDYDKTFEILYDFRHMRLDIKHLYQIILLHS